MEIFMTQVQEDLVAVLPDRERFRRPQCRMKFPAAKRNLWGSVMWVQHKSIGLILAKDWSSYP